MLHQLLKAGPELQGLEIEYPRMKIGTAQLVMKLCASLCITLTLGACATRVPEPAQEVVALESSPWAVASSGTARPAPWQHQLFPGKRPNDYRYTRLDGREAMVVRADTSVSMLRQTMRVESADLGNLSFSWKVPSLLPAADMRERELDDSPVRIVLAFEGDRSKFSARDAMLSELAHALTGEPMPYATLMYVWCNYVPPGTVLQNSRTSRIRKLVMESGPGKLGQWQDYARDVRADFERAYGEAPGALVSVGIMTDTDNTRSSSTAWYGPVRHVRAAQPARALP